MPTDLQTILNLSVPVIVRVAQRNMRMDDALALAPGAIVELDKASEDELELLINNKPIGNGLAVKVGENFGIRVTNVGSPQERIEALGS